MFEIHPDKRKIWTTDKNYQGVEAITWTCGYCNSRTNTRDGWDREDKQAQIRICACGRPTFFEENEQIPSAIYGTEINYLPDTVRILYEEVRKCMGIQAYTLAVAGCRKILMNVAVNLGDGPGKSFVSYVEYLDINNHIPRKSKVWIDCIRSQGNEATHEIQPQVGKDAKIIVSFTEMLLKITYEYPSTKP